MKNFFTTKNIVITGIALFVVLLLLLIVPPVCDAYFSSAVNTGVNFQGTHIGGKDATEVAIMLDQLIAEPKQTTVKVADQTISLDLNSAGFSIDKEQTLAEIMALGKHNFLDSLLCRWQGWNAPICYQPDTEMFTTVTEALLQQAGLTEQRFDYTINGDQAEIVIRPDTETYAIETLYQEILADYPNVKAEYALSKDAITPITAQEIAQIINIPVMDARIDEKDGKKVVVPHQVGVSVEEESLAEVLKSGELEFSVPVTVLKPEVYTDDLSTDAFPNRLATYSTNYKEWETSRTSNVKLAAQKVNGTVLNSGDIFSFNQVVGKRSYENGFKDAKIFLADKVVDGTGGGICQVSSTIYPAVLYSDLKIVERRNHNFVVSYAKSGIDATVVYGSIDFKFQNSLQNPIKIKAFASNGVMTVEIWGTKENNNTVELTTEYLGSYARGVKYEYNENLAPGEEVVTQAGYDGLKVRAYRIVKDENGTVLRTDNLGVSNYVPLAKTIETSDLGLVETGIPTENPEENPEATPSPAPGEGETGEATESTPTPAPTEEVTPTPDPISQATPDVTPIPEATAEPTQEPIPEVTIPPQETPSGEVDSEPAASF